MPHRICRRPPWQVPFRLALIAALLATPAACGVPDLAGDSQGASASLAPAGVHFQTVVQGRFVGAVNNGGGAVTATATVAQTWETFALEDSNGGALQSGDSVFIRAGNGQLFQAVNGGGSTLNAASNNRLGWETFRIVKASGGGAINSGDVVGLQTSNGDWVSAQNGGGGTVTAGGPAFGSWESFRIGGTSSAPAPAPSPPPSPPPSGNPGGGLGAILGESAFNGMFPNRNGFYTYAGFVSAAATMPAFANTGDATARKREVAAFLANVGHETGDLVFIEEIQKADYCASSASCPCAPGKRYFGRGPLQLSWNFNYCAAGGALGVDLRANPDLVAQDASLSWRTAIWFWMTSTGAGSRTCHDAIVSGAGFGETIRTINGSLECNGGNSGAVQSRVGRYQRFCGQLGVDPGGNQGC